MFNLLACFSIGSQVQLPCFIICQKTHPKKKWLAIPTNIIDIHRIYRAIPYFPKLLLYRVSERNNVRYFGNPTLIMRDYKVVYACNLLNE